MNHRQIGKSNLYVSPVAMGCWPITGITSTNVTEEHSLATLRAAFDSGINFFDTAYIYGYEGESERLIARALGDVRDKIVIASKCGLHWGSDQKQARDARPETIKKECEESLQRLNTDRIDLYYLHAPDPNVPIAESAGAIGELLSEGKILAAGVSNFTEISQYEEFHAVCTISADQPFYNMLQREIEREQLPWCLKNNVSVNPYWPLMKGFLAGKIKRDHVWASNDGRQRFPVFVGEEWEKTHAFLDEIRPIAAEAEMTVAQLAIAWVIAQPGIGAALCGAKRPEQIQETAQAMNHTLTQSQLAKIAQAIQNRGEVNRHPAT